MTKHRFSCLRSTLLHRFRNVSVLVVLLLVLLALVPGQVRATKGTAPSNSRSTHAIATPSSAGSTRGITPSAGSVGVDATIDCTNSPFGRQFVVGQVSQEFLSYTDGNGLLHADRLSLNNTDQLAVEKAWTSPDVALSTNLRVGSVAVDRDGDEHADLVQALQTTSK